MDENGAVVFPMVKHPFVVGFLVAELPMMVEPEMCGNRESVSESEGNGLVHYPSPEEAYALSPGFGSGVKSWNIECVKDEPMRMCGFSADQRANAINIARSLAMAYVMDQVDDMYIISMVLFFLTESCGSVALLIRSYSMLFTHVIEVAFPFGY